jgi:hypothetical protein
VINQPGKGKNPQKSIAVAARRKNVLPTCDWRGNVEVREFLIWPF